MTTTTFDFDLPAPRFDEETANAGIPIPVVDEYGHHWGTYTILLQDDSNPRFRLSKQRYFKKHSDRIRPMTEFQKLVDRMVEQPLLIDWKDVKAGGKDVPFSKDAARALLNNPKAYFVMEVLWAASHDVTRFKSDADEDEAGN